MLVDKKYVDLKIRDKFKPTSVSDWMVKTTIDLTFDVKLSSGRCYKTIFYPHTLVLVEDEINDAYTRAMSIL